MNAVPTTSRFARGVVSLLVHAFSNALCAARATVLIPSLKLPIVSVSVLSASAPRTPHSFHSELENSTVGTEPFPLFDAAAPAMTLLQFVVPAGTGSTS